MIELRSGMRCWLLVAAVIGCRGSAAPPGAPADHGYLKGQLHVHSNNSGDSKTAPEDVVRWYRAHHFDFIVFTDHNSITTTASSPDLLAIPGVELTQNLQTCYPPPPPKMACLLHVNALFVTGTNLDWSQARAGKRLDLYRDALAQAKQLGGIAQLNHPNFAWAADATLIQALAGDGLGLFEVANQSSDVNNEGDAAHQSTEALWDAVLTAGGKLYGTATDDAHYYDDAEPGDDTGDRGWVMVHARRDPMSIRDALARGDFYASNGVVLARIERRGDTLTIDVADEPPGDHAFVFIGTGGKELAQSRGRSATLPLAGLHGYVRAVVTDSAGHKAWVQPIWL